MLLGVYFQKMRKTSNISLHRRFPSRTVASSLTLFVNTEAKKAKIVKTHSRGKQIQFDAARQTTLIPFQVIGQHTRPKLSKNTPE
jgi:hypothetical protein